ncbi:extracellular solute-binding protein family 1 [Actinobacteria bacterium OK074]|nr:extracellular solute-binding protein family 1 [Actinobacteria bacterium OK074]
MQRVTRTFAVLCAGLLTGAGVTACGGGSDSASSSDTLTYWATNQGTSLDADKAILQPEIAKFTKRTGIKVDLEVIPWTTLLNRILTATTSGKGPDVLNIGNTWSASLQATGAFVPWDKAMLDKVGGKSRFLPAALQSTGATGQDPVGLPLYTKAYEFYYNKKLFKAAGITQPPTTWAEFLADAKKLTKDTDGDGKTDQWGLTMEGASYTMASHFAFILGKQHGARIFDGHTPKFDDQAMVDGIDQWVDWFGKDGIINPSDAEITDTAPMLKNFSSGKAGMLLVQTLGSTMDQFNMTTKDYGVAPMPALDASGGADDIGSFVAGSNVTIFKNTKNLDGATQFVKFLTSAKEQVILNKAYGSIPSVVDAKDPAFETDEFKVARDTLADRAMPLPQITEEAQFETLVGKAMNGFAAQAATGKQPSASDVRSEMSAANQKLTAGQ